MSPRRDYLGELKDMDAMDILKGAAEEFGNCVASRQKLKLSLCLKSLLLEEEFLV
jgi:hypothetical protein